MLFRSILTTTDNIFMPPISDKDTPETKAFKLATRLKNCDINKYENKFGNNFANEKREFSKNEISLKKIKRIGEILDMKITMVFEDKDDSVPNKMGTKISSVITGDNMMEE